MKLPQTLHRYKKIIMIVALGIFLILASVGPAMAGEVETRIKEITRIKGDNSQALVGIGIVVGLDRTGDSTRNEVTSQMLANTFERFGITVPSTSLQTRNSAVVVVTAQIPGSVRAGDSIDVTVSSMGDARSLRGGTLFITPLLDDNQDLAAYAQGPIQVGGISEEAGGSRVAQGHTLVGIVPGGANLLMGYYTNFGLDGKITLILDEPDFTTASRIAEVINKAVIDNIAFPLDNIEVEVEIPPAFEGRVVDFVSEITQLPVRPDAVGRGVINERTGTVVITNNVRIGRVAVSHGSTRVTVTTTRQVSQPPPLSPGETEVVEEAVIEIMEGTGQAVVLEGVNDIQDLVDALNMIGAGPQEIITIFREINAAGALYGELVIR